MRYKIYIPLWLYYNVRDVKVYYHVGETSTFHSGYITIRLVIVSIGTPLDLHSTLVILQSVFGAIPASKQRDLHSTLVILQFWQVLSDYFPDIIYIPLWLYYNSLILLPLLRLHSSTFHSGYITMLSPFLIHPLIVIYIPLWLYYNWYWCSNCFHGYPIYIPLWLYYN